MNSIADLPNEYHCHRKFYKLIWGECTCSKCGSKKLLLRNNYEFCSSCRYKSSVKAETIFRNSKLTFRQIFILIYCWQKKCSIGEITRLLKMSYPTVSLWLRRLRMALKPSNEVLSGKVEVDGSYFGRRKFGSQRLVIGAINPMTNRIRLKVIPYRSRKCAEDFITKAIKEKSLVVTDGYKGYNELPLLGYKWQACDHSTGFFGPTNHIEALWSSIKRALRYIYRDLTFNLKDLNLILREWENRHNHPELFYNVDNYLKSCGCSTFFS